MKLSIVVTHYREPQEVYKPLFDSIAMQIGADLKDIEVIVINDGNDSPGFDINFLEKYPFESRVIFVTKGGVSKARNKGLDEANGDYVMFCDCDDEFCSVFGLRLLFDAMESEPQMITSPFVEENLVTEEYHLVRKEHDITFIHGKAFRREWLKEKDLRFKDELTIHEDGYFVSLCDLIAEKKEYIEEPFYVWRWNENSVVRKDRKDFLLRTYGNLLDSREAIIEQLKKRGYEEDVLRCVAKSIIDIYYDFNTNVFIGADIELKKKAMLRIRRFWTKYKEDFRKCDGKTVQTVSMMSRVNALKKGMSMETVSIREFLQIVESFKL